MASVMGRIINDDTAPFFTDAEGGLNLCHPSLDVDVWAHVHRHPPTRGNVDTSAGIIIEGLVADSKHRPQSLMVVGVSGFRNSLRARALAKRYGRSLLPITQNTPRTGPSFSGSKLITHPLPRILVKAPPFRNELPVFLLEFPRIRIDPERDYLSLVEIANRFNVFAVIAVPDSARASF